MSYSTKGFLIGHETGHIGERSFKCAMCGKSFSELGYLKRNMRIEDPHRRENISVHQNV